MVNDSFEVSLEKYYFHIRLGPYVFSCKSYDHIFLVLSSSNAYLL